MARIADIPGIKQIPSVRSKISQIVTRAKALTLEAARKHANQSHSECGVRDESAGEYVNGEDDADSALGKNRFINLFYSNLKSAIEREIVSTFPPPSADEGTSAIGSVVSESCPSCEGTQADRRVAAAYKALLDVDDNRGL